MYAFGAGLATGLTMGLLQASAEFDTDLKGRRKLGRFTGRFDSLYRVRVRGGTSAAFPKLPTGAEPRPSPGMSVGRHRHAGHMPFRDAITAYCHEALRCQVEGSSPFPNSTSSARNSELESHSDSGL